MAFFLVFVVFVSQWTVTSGSPFSHQKPDFTLGASFTSEPPFYTRSPIYVRLLSLHQELLLTSESLLNIRSSPSHQWAPTSLESPHLCVCFCKTKKPFNKKEFEKKSPLSSVSLEPLHLYVLEFPLTSVSSEALSCGSPRSPFTSMSSEFILTISVFRAPLTSVSPNLLSHGQCCSILQLNQPAYIGGL